MVKKRTPESANSDLRSYKGVGIVFFAAGLGFLLAETARVSAVPFLILGLTFFVIGQEGSASKSRGKDK